MNWNVVQAVADVIAAAGVIVSLLYLAKQVRATTNAVQASTVLRGVEMGTDLRAAIWGDRDNALVYVSALSGKVSGDPVDQVRQRMFWLDLARRHEAMFFQHRAGRLPDDIWRYWSEEIRLAWSSPGGRTAATALREFLYPQFAAFVSALQEQTLPGHHEVFRRAWTDALTKND